MVYKDVWANYVFCSVCVHCCSVCLPFKCDSESNTYLKFCIFWCISVYITYLHH